MDISKIIDSGKSPYDSHIIWIDKLCEELEEDGSKFFLYGASLITVRLLEKFFDRGLMPCCLCDSNEDTWGTRMSSVAVLSPEDAVRMHPDAICVIGIRAAGAHYKSLSERLENAGCKKYYVLTWDDCPRHKELSLVRDVQNSKEALLSCKARMEDNLSKERVDSFICAFLSSLVGETISMVLSEYKSLDGHALQSDLISLNSEDVIVSCRCGLDKRNAKFLELLKKAKRAHLLEPCISSRMLTAEMAGAGEGVFLYPYIAAAESGSQIEFDEKLCIRGYIDILEYSETKAKGVAVDDLAIRDATVMYLDMSADYTEVLRGAGSTIASGVRAIIITGFRYASEIPAIIESYPEWKYYFRYFGGQDIREGYALIAMP